MKRILQLLLLISLPIQAKVLIITHSYNRPDFIELHAKTFQAFLQDDYEYVVFNDASDPNMRREIKQTCANLGIRCFGIPHHAPNRNTPSYRHMDGISYALKQVGFEHKGIVTLIDSDMFLLKPFSIEKFMNGYDLSGELQGRGDATHEVRYLSPVLVFMNMQTMPNRQTISFEGGMIDGFPCDVGGHTYYYFQNNPSIKYRYINVLHIGAYKEGLNCQTCNNLSCSQCVNALVASQFDKESIKFIQSCHTNIEFFLDHTFLHYRGGSNWDFQSPQYHQAKTKAFNNYLSACFDDK